MLKVHVSSSIAALSKRAFLIFIFASGMSACVTTTTGGFIATASDEQAVRDYVNLAVGYYDANDMAGARRNISNALDIDNRHSPAYNVLALILQTEGDIELAEQTFQRAISLDRENSRARNNYAALLFSLQKYSEAFDQLQEVVDDSMYEGRAIAFENLGRSALMLENDAAAENAFERALQLNANLYLSALELSNLRLGNGNLQGARTAFNQYLTIVQFYNIAHSPKALLAGIQIEGAFANQALVEEFTLLLMSLYPESPEYKMFQDLADVN